MCRYIQRYGPYSATQSVQYCNKPFAAGFMLVDGTMDGNERVMDGHHGLSSTSRTIDIYLVYSVPAPDSQNR